MCLAIPGKVLEIRHDPSLPMGKVQFGGIAKEVCLAYVPEAAVGDYVLVHVGFAISTVDPVEAQRIFHYLRQIGELPEPDATPPPVPAPAPDQPADSSP